VARSSGFLSTGQAAGECSFSDWAILQWVCSGMLRADSSPGGRHRVDPDELAEFLRRHALRVPPELRALGPRRILVVGPAGAPVFVALGQALADLGIEAEVEMAGGGVAACLRVPALLPHLLILDMDEPGDDVDIVKFCRSLRAVADLAETRVLLLAADASDPRLTLALEAGADDWLPMPATLAALAAKVRELLRGDTARA